MTVTFGNQPTGKFVFKKQSKIRWRRSALLENDVPNGLESLFVTGSWDGGSENEVSLWQWNEDSEPMEVADGQTGVSEPQLLASFNHAFGDVNEMQFLTPDLFSVGSSDGSVTLLRISKENGLGNRETTGYNLAQMNKWNLHKSSSCNGVTCLGDHIVSVGSDGKIFLLNAKKQSPVRKYESADSGSISTVLFVKQEEIAAANNRGQVKIWDLRSKEADPVKTCHLAMDLIGITAIARHPTQPHIFVGGGSNGVLAFWDLRGHQDYPLSVVKAHSDAVSEVHFHDFQPDHLFTCSQNGDVWHWNGAKLATQSYFSNPNTTSSEGGCIWLNSESVKNRVDTKPLMAKQSLPTNSMSILNFNVLVAGDNEAIYVIPGIKL